MSNKLISAGVGIALVLSAIGLFTGDTVITNPVVKETVVGTASGPDVTEHTYFFGGANIGGGVFSTSSIDTTETLEVTAIDDESLINFTVGHPSGVTLTLPASTTMGKVCPRGSFGLAKTVYVWNATTAAATLTVAGGAGTLLNIASTTLATASKAIQPGGFASLDFVCKPNTDIEVLMTAGQ